MIKGHINIRANGCHCTQRIRYPVLVGRNIALGKANRSGCNTAITQGIHPRCSREASNGDNLYLITTGCPGCQFLHTGANSRCGLLGSLKGKQLTLIDSGCTCRETSDGCRCSTRNRRYRQTGDVDASKCTRKFNHKTGSTISCHQHIACTNTGQPFYSRTNLQCYRSITIAPVNHHG